MISIIVLSSQSQQVVERLTWHFVLLYTFQQSVILPFSDCAIEKGCHRRDHYGITIKGVFTLEEKRRVIAKVNASFLGNKNKKKLCPREHCILMLLQAAQFHKVNILRQILTLNVHVLQIDY